MQDKIRVLIADDHPILRNGLRDLIRQHSDLQVVGEAENGARVLEAVVSLKPDIVILDIDMPVMDGIDTARILKDKENCPLLVFLTIHKNRSVLRALRQLNVCGYVLKESAMDDIVDCIRAVVAGKTYLSAGVKTLEKREEDTDTDHLPYEIVERLTETEKKVLSEIARSRTNKEIADQLFLSVRTVETHRYNICAKLDLKGSHSLFKFAVKNRSAIDSAIKLGSST